MTWSYITSQETLISSLPEVMKYPVISIDLETRGLDVFRDAIVLIQIGTPQQVYIYDARTLDLKPLFEVLQHYMGIICFHNAKFDCKMLRYNYGFLPNRVFDTMLAETLIVAGIGPLFSSLNYLSTSYLNRPLAKEIRDSFIDSDVFFLGDKQLNYAADDAQATLDLYPILSKRLEELELLRVAELEFELVKVISDMELVGVAFDQTVWGNCHKKTLEDLEQARADFYHMIAPLGSITVEATNKGVKYNKEIPIADVNLNSPTQIKEVLHRHGVNVPNTADETLSGIDHPVVRQLSLHRKFAKRVNTYGSNFFEYVNPITGRIHTNYNQIGAATGRLSSDGPNLQNIPNPAKDKGAPNYRAAFVATPGYVMVIADYSQIELRILAEVSKEPKFLKAYADGADLHTQTATVMYHIDASVVSAEQRSTAKNTNFATAYGSGAGNISRKFKIPLAEAQQLLDNFHKGYPVLSKFLAHSGQEAVVNHYSKTLLGRRRNFQIPSITNPKFQKIIAAIKREGTNHIIQGTSADMTKMAKVMLYNRIGELGGRLLLTVHDEIVSEFPEKYAEEGKQIVEQAMIESGQRLITSVPVLVDAHISSHWSK